MYIYYISILIPQSCNPGALMWRLSVYVCVTIVPMLQPTYTYISCILHGHIKDKEFFVSIKWQVCYMNIQVKDKSIADKYSSMVGFTPLV